MIITRSEDSIVCHISVIDPILSDQYAVCCKVLLPKPPLEKKETTYRSLKRIDFARFREDIKNLNLVNNDIASVTDLVEAYNAKLASLLNDYAPLRNKVDPIPAIVLEECLHDLMPVITRLVNRLLPPSKY